MKRILYIIVLIVISSFRVLATDSLSSEAETLYVQKKYKEAITVYETILSQNKTSYKLYYNLGNCYFKTNQLGKAIYNYELAHKLNPKDADVSVNLNIASAKTIDKIENKENYFISSIKSGVVNLFTNNGWAWLSIISLISSFALFFIFFITKNNILKRLGFFMGSLCFLVFIVSMILGYSSLNSTKELTRGIILSSQAKIYTEPSTTSDSKFTLHEGTKVSVLIQNANWVNIKLQNGNEGWVQNSILGLF